MIKGICLFCDEEFSLDDFDEPQTAYLMCPKCLEMNRKKAKSEVKRKPKKKVDDEYKNLQKALAKKGIDIELYYLKKIFKKVDKQKMIRQILKGRKS